MEEGYQLGLVIFSKRVARARRGVYLALFCGFVITAKSLSCLGRIHDFCRPDTFGRFSASEASPRSYSLYTTQVTSLPACLVVSWR